MLLAVDIGNSQTSFGVFENRKLVYHWRAETKPSRTSDEYGSLLFPLMDRAKLNGDWEGVVLCSVVPPADRAFEYFCREYWNLSPTHIDSNSNLGFSLNVDFPHEVGADRLANAAFVCESLPLPAIVIDIGTATTFDVITAKRTYEGGVILPGVRLAFESLGSKTSKLPMVDLVFPQSVIGKNTVECIQAGILFGYCDLLDGLLDRTMKEMAKEMGEVQSVCLTGGYGYVFSERLRTKVKYLPNLTLEGIEILHRRNKAK